MVPHKPNVTLILFQAPMHKREVILAPRKALFDALEAQFSLTILPSQDFTDQEAARDDTVFFPFIASGGSEEVLLHFGPSRLPGPFLVLFDNRYNSLAASLEIATYLTQGKRETPLIKSLESLTWEDVCLYGAMQRAARYMRRANVSIWGEPSSWLIASAVDYKAISALLGTRFQQFPVETLQNLFVAQHTANQDEETKAQTMCRCLSQLLQETQSNALTIRCFELLQATGVSACLALAQLNAQGTVAACEGDVPALLTMMMVRGLTQQSSFMCNPSHIAPDAQTVRLAHCTAPLDFVPSYVLDTHFESGKSVAIRAQFAPDEPYTLVKWAGNKLERFFTTEAVSVSQPYSATECRTQLQLRCDAPLSAYTTLGMGNHVVVVKGRYSHLFTCWNQHLTYLRQR